MRRRDFISLLGGAVATWPVATRAQPALPVIGFLRTSAAVDSVATLNAFREGLKEVGFIDGQNIVIESRWGENQYDRLPTLAADLLSRQVAVLAAGPLPAALAAKAATNTVPIVFVSGVDPVEAGLVASLNRPGGNATGVCLFTSLLLPKKFELLRELLPNAEAVAILVNPKNTNTEPQTRNLRKVTQAMGLRLHVANASSDDDFDAAFSDVARLSSGGLIIGADAFLHSRGQRLAALAAHYAVPTIYESNDAVRAGGLMSYGSSAPHAYHQIGIYTGRILKGAKPAELPVLQPVKIEMAINLNAAKALGLEVSPTLLLRADEMIE
jgi:putative ABC transport system substrate-binding protein